MYMWYSIILCVLYKNVRRWHTCTCGTVFLIAYGCNPLLCSDEYCYANRTVLCSLELHNNDNSIVIALAVGHRPIKCYIIL